MSRSDEKRLDDMREMCARALAVVDRGHAAFQEDELLRLALERALEIIGEAAHHVSPESRADYPTVPWDDIVRLRILLAHHYHRSAPERLWVIATESVPALAEALGPLIEHDE